MKKLKYESVNEIRRNGIFTRSQFRKTEGRMEGVVACPSGEETKFFTVVMFRDKTTGRFPWEDLFVGGKKVVFKGRMNTHRSRSNDKLYDEIIIDEMHENIPVEIEVPDDGARDERRRRDGGGYHREGGDRRPPYERKPAYKKRPLNPDFSQAAGLEPVPEGLFDDNDDAGDEDQEF